MSSLIKDAEVNLVNICLAHRHAISFVEALNRFSWKYFDRDSEDCKNFNKGLNLIKQALNSQLDRHTLSMLVFAGVGGDGAKEHCKGLLKEWFKDEPYQHTVMQFLSENGTVPYYWESDKEDAFRDEVKQMLSEDE